MAKKQKCIDHLGNQFSSIKDMCHAHKILVNTYLYRIKKGYRIEDALSHTRPSRKNTEFGMGEPVIDYKGNKFKNMTDMCKHYGISLTLFMKRRERGKSLKEALKPVKTYKDHLGNTYSSLKALGKKYNLHVATIKRRLEMGYSIEEALTKDKGYFKSKRVKDHLGNEYVSYNHMCEVYKVNIHTFRSDIRKGKSIEEALTRKKRPFEKHMDVVMDHKGNKFKNVKKMCEYYGISYNTYFSRVYNLGWSLEKALETNVRKGKRD